MFQGERASGVAYTGPRATYVVLSGISTLFLTLLIAIWHTDFSAVIAILGLVAIYIGSAELLALFGVLAPCSLILDIVWMASPDHGHHGHGWVIFFTVLDMLSKVAGTVMAWSLYSSGGEAQYTPINNQGHGQGGGNMAGPPATAYHPPAGYGAQQNDPFTSYAPPRPDATMQPGGYLPTSQAPALHTLQ